jgi:transketolase
MRGANQAIDELCVNTLRTLAADMAQKANSGHPGLPMGAAPMGYVLWQHHLVIDPSAPAWPDRDRFVLSPGHGSPLQYGLMHLAGYEDLSLQALKAFRQWKSKTPGHPEFGVTTGVEATTGPLGQGAANVVGMAIAERMLAHRFNRPGHSIVDHFTYAIVSDGDLMEGVSGEAASLAGQLKLGKLICLYDANDVTLDGPTSLAFSVEDVCKRYEAYGWHVVFVADGDRDYEGIERAIAAARSDARRPSMIVVKTTIGFGSPNKQGSSKAHGAPLGAEELVLTKKNLGWDPDAHFHVPDVVRDRFASGMERGHRARLAWEERFRAYEQAFPELAEEWRGTWEGALPEGWDADLPVFVEGEDQPTRNASGKALNAIAGRVPWLVGGDADIGSSTKSQIKKGGSFDGTTGAGRNIHFGVREHAMTAVANGMAYHGGVRPLVSTFFTFVDYMRPSIRVAALAHLPVLLVFSHDSLAVGEDGPTHQPVEQLASLRLMPNVVVLRPADPNETVEAWRWSMQYTNGPVALITTRQKVPVIDRTKYAAASGLHRGAYVLADPERVPDVVVIATGSEVSLALQAHEQLAEEGIATRVVSMPSWEVFQSQPSSYVDEVLPAGIPRVAVEAGVSFGWERWVGRTGVIVSVDRYGASAPGHVAMEKLGFRVDNVKDAVRRALAESQR